MVLESSLHDAIGLRLAGADQRYTTQRRAIIETLDLAARPLTVPEILEAMPQLTQSSAYRNMQALIELGIIERVVGADDHARFELAETLSGHHHHHLICAVCGRVEDLHSSPKLERALGEAARRASEQGYEISDHRLDLIGRCAECARGMEQ